MRSRAPILAAPSTTTTVLVATPDVSSSNIPAGNHGGVDPSSLCEAAAAVACTGRPTTRVAAGPTSAGWPPWSFAGVDYSKISLATLAAASSCMPGTTCEYV